MSGRLHTGLLYALLLLGVYAGLWRPARALMARHVAYPLLAAVDTPRARRFVLDAEHQARQVAIRTAAGTDVAAYTAPAGFRFLLGALLLVGFFPRRRYGLYLLAAHLLLGGLTLAALTLGLGWTDAGFQVHHFLHDYLTPAVSLAAPVAAFGYTRRRRARPPDPASRRATPA